MTVRTKLFKRSEQRYRNYYSLSRNVYKEDMSGWQDVVHEVESLQYSRTVSTKDEIKNKWGKQLPREENKP